LSAVTVKVYADPNDRPQMRTGEVFPLALAATDPLLQAVTVNDVARVSAGVNDT
jgi:hypothetical protein